MKIQSNIIKSVFVVSLSLVFLLMFFSTNHISQAVQPNALSSAGSEWEIVTIDSVGDYGAETSISLDSDGFPHVIYWLDTGKYAYKDANGWNTDLFDDNGFDAAMVMGHDDYPRVCYRNLNEIDYAYQNASGWHNEFLFGYTSNSTYTSLQVDEHGYPHCTFYWETVTGNLIYYYQDATGWDWEYIDDPELTHHGAYNSLALDTNGYPHVSYYHNTLGVLRYAYKELSDWHFETVDDQTYVGSHTSLALDSTGYPHISYFYCGTSYFPKCNEFDLRYAYRDATGWHIQTVDSTGDVGTYTTLDLDSKDHPHISYYDTEQGNLKYAYLDPTDWHIEIVDSEGDVGRYTSLEIGPNDEIHISYIDHTNGSLKYAYLAGTITEPKIPIFLPVVAK